MLSQLLQEKENEHRMWSQSDEGRNESFEKCRGTPFRCVCDQVEYTLKNSMKSLMKFKTFLQSHLSKSYSNSKSYAEFARLSIHLSSFDDVQRLCQKCSGSPLHIKIVFNKTGFQKWVALRVKPMYLKLRLDYIR